MADIYGVDIAATTDLPDPEELAREEENVVRALARRFLTDQNALEEIGDDEGEYDSFDVRDYLGGRIDEGVLDEIRTNGTACCLQDPRVSTIDVDASFAGGVLSVEFSGRGKEGPFSGVLSVSELETSLLIRGDE